MAIGDHDLHTLAGAYVLDAVTAGERAAFAGHLAGCEQCRQEIREFRAATARPPPFSAWGSGPIRGSFLPASPTKAFQPISSSRKTGVTIFCRCIPAC